MHVLYNRKSSIKPLSTFYEGLEELEVGEEGKPLGGGPRKGIFYLNNKGKIREKVVFFIDKLPQTGKMLLHWFDDISCKRNDFQGKLWRM